MSAPRKYIISRANKEIIKNAMSIEFYYLKFVDTFRSFNIDN